MANPEWGLRGVTFGLVAFLALLGRGEAATSPHAGDGQTVCSACHPGAAGEVAADKALEPADPIAACTACHPQAPGRDHPVGVSLRLPAPPDLPLSDAGKLVCTTCHDPHNETQFLAMLRMEVNALCVACHR